MHKQNEHAKEPSATKSGPGRYHKEGHQKASPMTRSAGAGLGFSLHKASKEKIERRSAVKALGRRNANRFLRLERRAIKGDTA